MKRLSLQCAILCSLVFFASCNSDITTNRGIPVGNLIWAPGNLVNNGSTYSFAPAQELCSYTSTGGDYFCWNTLNSQATTSTNITDVWDATTDPCAKVSPRGKWHTPSYAEFYSLINSGSICGAKNTVQGCYFGTSTIPAQAYADNYVFLPASGMRVDNSTKMYNVGQWGNYWISIPTDPVFGHYRMSFYGFSATIDSSSSGNSGYSIRCVSAGE